MFGRWGLIHPNFIAHHLPPFPPKHYSRHPNFFAEQAIWWTFHLFSYAANLAATPGHKLSPPYVNWTVIGPFLLILLFQGSTDLTEKLTLKKYPRYRAYMKTTSRLLPWKPKEHRD